MAIGTKITLAGAKLLAKALDGKELKFTRGAFGDAIQGSSMKTPTQAERDALTALIHEKMSLPITKWEIVDDQIIVSLQVKNTDVTEDFRIAEIGLFAEDPDSHQEKLYAYAFQGNDGDKMYAANTDVQLEFQVELVTKICGAQNVTAVITQIYEGLTQEDLDAHIASSLPHPNWDVVLNNTFNTHVNSTNPHPNWDVIKPGVGLSETQDTLNVTFANQTIPASKSHLTGVVNFDGGFKTADSVSVIFGGSNSISAKNDTINATGATIVGSPIFKDATASATYKGLVKVGKNLYMSGDSLNAAAGEADVESRLRQVEINQANLYMLLEGLHKMGVQANLLMVEDFKTLKYTHLDSSAASIAAVGKECQVDSISFLRPSSSFVITDGLVYNQLATAQSISSDGENYIINTAEKLKDTTSKGQVYRSSVTIKDDKAYGAGLVKKRTHRNKKTWRGEGSATPQNIGFNMYASLASSYDLDGDFAFTSDGYFTLE